VIWLVCGLMRYSSFLMIRGNSIRVYSVVVIVRALRLCWLCWCCVNGVVVWLW